MTLTELPNGSSSKSAAPRRRSGASGLVASCVLSRHGLRRPSGSGRCWFRCIRHWASARAGRARDLWAAGVGGAGGSAGWRPPEEEACAEGGSRAPISSTVPSSTVRSKPRPVFRCLSCSSASSNLFQPNHRKAARQNCSNCLRSAAVCGGQRHCCTATAGIAAPQPPPPGPPTPLPPPP